MLDAVVVGGGPAGLSAATWLGRYRCRTLLVDAGEPRNRWVDQSHGYLTRDPVPPRELLSDAVAGLGQYATVARRTAQVEAVRRVDEDRFELEVAGDVVTSRRLVLATGVRDRFPEVEGFFEHYGASVFHCPSCDGFEASGRDVVAIGWDANVVGFALTLDGWARSVTILTDGRRFEGDDRHRRVLAAAGIRVLQEDAVAFLGTRGDLRAVRLRSGETIPCALAFFTIGHEQNANLADQLGCKRDGDSCVVVDERCQTSVRGVYAAGDITPGLQLIQVAAAKGTIAGVSCAQSLWSEGPAWATGPPSERAEGADPG